MSRDRSGYVFKDKDRKWFARVTLRDVSGKRRNIKRRAKDKTQAKQPFNAGSPLISSVDENKRDRVLTREEETRLLAAIGKASDFASLNWPTSMV